MRHLITPLHVPVRRPVSPGFLCAAYAKRRYQILRSFPQSLHMPTGYAGMISLALIPKLFFKVMNPLVERSEKWGNHVWRGGSSAEIPLVKEKYCLCQPDADGAPSPP